MIVGFTWGGWVTGGSAGDMAEDALEQGRAQVAAVVCVEEFMAAADARPQIASLKSLSEKFGMKVKGLPDGG
jgi:hypothetical protein